VLAYLTTTTIYWWWLLSQTIKLVMGGDSPYQPGALVSLPPSG